MITNKEAQLLYQYVAPAQRLGDKTLFTTQVTKQDGSTVRYFSGTDAEIYFDDIYIDEVVQIQFQVQQNAMPLYGYNSYVYDDVAVGTRIVSGTFSVNFTKAAYLYEVLQTLKSMGSSSTVAVPSDEDDAAFESNSQRNPAVSLDNPVEHSRRLPLWNKSFDLVISYGDAKQDSPVAGSSMLILENVTLTSCSQQFSVSGEPIMETYSFMARDIAFPPNLSGGSGSNATTPSATPAQTKTEEMVFDDAAYREYNLSRENVWGQLDITYHSGVKIKSLKIGLEIDTNTDRGVRDVPVNSETSITYKVPGAWRNAILKHYKAGNKTAKFSVAVVYESNGKESSVPATKMDVRLETVLTDASSQQLA